eukprot:s1179_g35.t1
MATGRRKSPAKSTRFSGRRLDTGSTTLRGGSCWSLSGSHSGRRLQVALGALGERGWQRVPGAWLGSGSFLRMWNATSASPHASAADGMKGTPPTPSLPLDFAEQLHVLLTGHCIQTTCRKCHQQQHQPRTPAAILSIWLLSRNADSIFPSYHLESELALFGTGSPSSIDSTTGKHWKSPQSAMESAPCPPCMEPPSMGASEISPSTWDLLKAMGAFHDSLAAQLSDLAAQVQQIHDKAPPTMLTRRKPSNSSEHSCSSLLKAPPQTSRSARSGKSPEGGVQNINSPTQSLALQLLHMDMPHHLLLNKASKALVTKGHSADLSVPSLVLVGHDGKREKKKRTTFDSQSGSHLELPGAMVPVLPNSSATLESGLDKQSLRVPSSEQPADSMHSGNSVRSDGPRHVKSSSERSWAHLGPVGADFESEDLVEQPSIDPQDRSQSPRPSSRPSSQPSVGAGAAGRSASHPVTLHQEQLPPRSKTNEAVGPSTSKREQFERRPSVSFLEKDPVGSAVSHKASLPSSGSRRKSQTCLELHRAISTGNLTEVFKVKEKELTANLQSPGGQRVTSKKIPTENAIREAPLPEKQVELSSNESSTDSEEEQETEKASADDQLHLSRSDRWWLKVNFLSNFLVLHASKALGLIPMFELGNDDGERLGWRWLKKCSCETLSRLYHWFILLFLLLGVITLAMDLSFCHLKANEAEKLCIGLEAYNQYPPLAADLALFLAAAVVLFSWGGVLKYKEMTELIYHSTADLSSYCEQNSLDQAWKIWSSSDAVWSLLLWLMLIMLRSGIIIERGPAGSGYVSQFLDSPPALMWSLAVRALCFLISSSVLVVASFWQVRTSHAMLLIVNAWSASFLGGHMSCSEAKHEWRRVSGLFRKTSRTFERCFAALGGTIVVLILGGLYDLRHGRDLEVLSSLSMALFLPAVLWTHASTTTACNRLPSLVTLCEAETEEEDQEYINLAMFLSLSECGFFVWDTCVSVSLVQKFLYFTVAIAGSIGFQTGALNFKQISDS